MELVGTTKKVESTMLERHGVRSFLESRTLSEMRNNSEIKFKIQQTKRKNRTFNSSKLEELAFKMLVDKFGVENVKRQHSTEKYPFNCDFFIVPCNLFIELNCSWTHGKHPYDKIVKKILKLFVNGWLKVENTI